VKEWGDGPSGTVVVTFSRIMGAMANFDVLPDSIAILILSKLENAQMVAQCAVVCHRWKMLTRLVDTLTFESFKLLEKKVCGSHSALLVFEIILHTSS